MNRVYSILPALADSDLHGLGIARAVQDLAGDRIRLWPASLYGTLDELAESGSIEELEDARRRPADESEQKRFCRLTRAGHGALAADTDRLALLVKVAKSRLKARAGAASCTAIDYSCVWRRATVETGTPPTWRPLSPAACRGARTWPRGRVDRVAARGL